MAQGAELCYNAHIAGAQALIPRDSKIIHPDGSAKTPGGGHYTEDSWNMQIVGVSRSCFKIAQ
jgi:hypothetical protein